MEKKIRRKNRKVVSIVSTTFVLITILTVAGGCFKGYSNETLYRSDIKTVCVEMFESKSFQRGIEYVLTDSLAKRIESQTPYKIVSSKDRADTVIRGYVEGVRGSVLSSERETGRALEKDLDLKVVFTWENLKTGEMIIENQSVTATATFSEWQNQGIRYATALAANRLAVKIVEGMEDPW